MILKNHQILAANHAVAGLLSRANLTTRARYTLILNQKILSGAVDIMREALPPSDRVSEFYAKRQGIFAEQAGQVAEGSANPALQQSLEALLEEYSAPLADQAKAEAELLAESTDLGLVPLALALLPDDGMTNEQIQALLPLLVDAGA